MVKKTSCQMLNYEDNKNHKFSGIEIRKQKEIHPSEWIQPWNLEPAFIVMGRIRGLVGVVTITKNECI
jgi:hypothetical protein